MENIPCFGKIKSNQIRTRSYLEKRSLFLLLLILNNDNYNNKRSASLSRPHRPARNRCSWTYSPPTGHTVPKGATRYDAPLRFCYCKHHIYLILCLPFYSGGGGVASGRHRTFWPLTISKPRVRLRPLCPSKRFRSYGPPSRGSSLSHLLTTQFPTSEPHI